MKTKKIGFVSTHEGSDDPIMIEAGRDDEGKTVIFLDAPLTTIGPAFLNGVDVRGQVKIYADEMPIIAELATELTAQL